MIIDKHLLVNGNVLLWITGQKEDNIENVLILSGGDVLLLKSIKHISMLYSDIRDDVLTLSFNELVKKYKLEGYEDIYYDVIKELKRDKYPKYDENKKEEYILSMLDHLPSVNKDCLLIVKKECKRLIKEIEHKEKLEKEKVK